MASLKTRPIAIIAGAGEGTGASIARRFAKSYNVVLLARSQATVNTVLASVQAQGGDGIAIPTDVADIASVANAFKIIKEKYPDAPVVAAIFNVSSFVKKPFLELELADYESGFATSG